MARAGAAELDLAGPDVEAAAAEAGIGAAGSDGVVRALTADTVIGGAGRLGPAAPVSAGPELTPPESRSSPEDGAPAGDAAEGDDLAAAGVIAGAGAAGDVADGAVRATAADAAPGAASTCDDDTGTMGTNSAYPRVPEGI
ncbi:hypothetical protein [Actinoplanes xinjiangensis]|uniref:hypothetical protein n=1 Tax=Actinoplanes xinjiangensis TaxID=512350 RepID=UPI0020121F1D|nr:hypothetical protein [Actinoplanes xinjiangensis]